MSISTYEHSF